MFTLLQIKDAHSSVKSGADFPAYISELKKLGVTSYETFVEDGHTLYQGREEQQLISEPRYQNLIIAVTSNSSQFKDDLEHHQGGGSDYFQFCRECARSGVEKWIVRLDHMTCSYYDKAGNSLLVENIPSLKS